MASHETLDDAAHLLDVLAGTVHAHLLGDDERVDVLLSQVTPEACRRVARLLRDRPHPDRPPTLEKVAA